MSFNIGLSALYAAQQEISVTGNNIANSGTTGFKSARTNFGDVYAASVLGGGGTQAGSGVSLLDIKQSFTQGNISFTNNTLDMAINGEGFFVLSGESGVSYSRAGAFGTDRNGFIINALGERLQGFAPSPTGQATGGGPLTDLRVTTGEIQPRPTTEVRSVINLDAGAAPSSIRGSTLVANGGTNGFPQSVSLVTDPRVNGYEEATIQVLGSDGVSRLVTVQENATANTVAQQFSGINGVTARGTTVVYLSGLSGIGADDVSFSINGRTFTADLDIADPDDLAAALNALAAEIQGAINNVAVRVDEVTGDFEIRHNTGADLVFAALEVPALVGQTLTVTSSQRNALTGQFSPNADPLAAETLALDAEQWITVGGIVEFTLDENANFAASTEDTNGDPIDPLPAGSIFGELNVAGILDGTPFESNQFDPRNPDTYYRSTAVTIYDSLGIQHALSMFFVKERPEAGGVANVWSVYFQVDGRNIGYDPNNDGTPVLARHDIRFNDNGVFDPNQTPIEITNWFPVDSGGRRVGAGPIPGNTNVSDQITNSNFRIDLSGVTQFGGDFSVQSNNQDGYSKGQLTGLEISPRGLVSARFSNGQSSILGEVALANFANPAGLSNLGGTRFSETSESGAASVSGAGTASLGLIQSGALEDSNVDLSEQLVQLIISQRNYQAAAQIISATDTAVQTIINL